MLWEPCQPLTVSPPNDNPANDRSTERGCSKGEKKLRSAVGCRITENGDGWGCESEDSLDACPNPESCTGDIGDVIGLERSGDATEDGTSGETLDNGGDGARCGGGERMVSSTVIGTLSRKPGERGDKGPAASTGLGGSGSWCGPA